MKRHIATLISALTLSLFAATVPPGTELREAEQFQDIGKGWYVAPHSNSGYTGMPSGGKLVRGHRADTGTLRDEFVAQKDGVHRIFIRYIDLGSVSMRQKIAFTVSVEQNGQTVTKKVFDDGASVRATPEGKKRWGNGWAEFVWGELSCPLKSGKFTIAITKNDSADATGLARNIDCVVVTSDTLYVPHVNDFQKDIYARIHAGKNQTEPMAVHLFGLWGGHYNITRKGLIKGVYTGLNREDYLKAGDTTPFFRINHLANLGKEIRYSFDAVRTYGKPLETAHFTIEFSHTANESGIFQRVTREGVGSGICVLVKNDGEVKLETDRDESIRDLERARATRTAPGRRPTRFPVATSLALSTASSNEVRGNELAALATLGLSSLSFAPPEISRLALDRYGFTRIEANCFLFSQTKPGGCYGSPDPERMERTIANFSATLQKYGLADHIGFISWMDEPGYALKHVLECPACIAKFPAFLAAQNLTAQELGVPTLDGLKPSGDAANPRLYYWTLRFYTSNLTGMYRTPTGILKKYLPEMRTAANFGTEITDSMVSHGNDWFDIYNSGALTFGWTEDWLNLFGTYQLCAFQTAAMRMVTAPNRREFGMYDILQERSEAEIKAKAFSHLGSGAKSLSFFSYGPHYANGDHSNRSPGALQAIRDITHAIGASEDALLAATPARGDAAMLFARTSDYWNYQNSREGGNPFGEERSLLFLLLQHSGVNIDLIGEDRLSAELANYRVLFAVDSHIEVENFNAIKAWVERGGILYLGAGALARDRYNAPLPALAERGDLELEKLKRKFLMQNLETLKPSGTVQFAGGTLPLILGKQSIAGETVLATAGQTPVLGIVNFGKGKIIASGFFPGLSYVKNARRTSPATMPNCWTEYPADGRTLMRLILQNTGLSAAITVDHYLVEAHLLDYPGGALLVLANWSGAPRQVTVSVKGDWRKAEGIRTAPTGVNAKNGRMTFRTNLADGDVITLTK